jgi:hypothetical protein
MPFERDSGVKGTTESGQEEEDRLQDLKEAARELYRVYRAQNAEKIYAAYCCDRFYVGTNPAALCRTCSRTPVSHELKDEKDIDNLEIG